MRFRHLPPEFVRGLAAEQQGLTNITAVGADRRSGRR